jgi:hypothetical protein
MLNKLVEPIDDPIDIFDNRDALVDLINDLNRIPEIQESRKNNSVGYRKVIEIIVSIAVGEIVTIDQIEEVLGCEVC